MRNGYREYDADTHVLPVAEALEPYVDPSFRPRLPELETYLVPARGAGADPDLHEYRIDRKFYRRILGEAGPHPSFTGGSTTWMGTQQPRAGVMDDNAVNRLKDMDDEGTDVHFLIPTAWTSVVGLGDGELEMGLIRAYHRQTADFCSHAPDRPRIPGAA